MEKINKVIIIGAGPAGYTASIYAARANLKPILITGNMIGGQLVNTNEIENWPGEEKKITGLDLMLRMKNHSEKFKTKIIVDEIKSVNFTPPVFSLLGYKNKYSSKTIIIATGASPKYLGLESEKKFFGKGVSSCATCDGFFFKNEIVAVIGGGNTAIEEALYLSKIAQKVYLIHRRNYFTAEKILVERMLKKVYEKKIILYKNCVVQEILGNKLGVKGIIIKKLLSKNNIFIAKIINLKVKGVFVAIGHTPNTSMFKDQINMNNQYIEIKRGKHEFFTQTSTPGIFAAGDVIDHVYKQAITAAASGCMAALDVDRYLNQ
ncbi:thioredoxin-disulfide reductase [Buchnera aphidicola (Kurisakia onigurumii)]|uniref:thioredoxin-disulfide reductase n=1 Tax=Buchnera aphidicola TaxID=9 RepID=UPI0031B6A86A